LDYHTRIITTLADVPEHIWDALVTLSSAPPILRHAYLHALHESDSACASTGWEPEFITLWHGNLLAAACPLYRKHHSYGEYVFDFAWADAYARHGLKYYPKLLSAVPFTPVPGTKLLARDDAARNALLDAVLAHAGKSGLSSLHLLWLSDTDRAAAANKGLMLRHGVQFHWQNRQGTNYQSFDDFLAALNAEKRKKIKQQERYVRDAGVSFEYRAGHEISAEDWAFFYQCYSRTYYEHGNAPYLTEAFFSSLSHALPQMWLLITAQQSGRRIAASLIALDSASKRAYGRYWGMAPREPLVPHLHFAACYYQPLRWCIEHGYAAFEGGAQGEHKMARGLLPVQTTSAHWLAEPAFADAVERYLAREGKGMEAYLDELAERSPMKRSAVT
jgi:uncharacterized protein